MNLPSSTTKDNAFGGERGGAIELFDDGTTFSTNDVEDMLDLMRMNSGVINDEDINAIMKKSTELLNKENLMYMSEKCVQGTRTIGLIFAQK